MLHFDFGKINEDVNNNGLRDFEGTQGKEFLEEERQKIIRIQLRSSMHVSASTLTS